MGFHVCEYCKPEDAPETSSGDVTLTFSNGRSFVVPDMLTHYILEHGYVPPTDFIDSVLGSDFVSGGREQAKSIGSEPVRVGYLKGPIRREGELLETEAFWFIARLTRLMRIAARGGDRRQTRSAQRCTT